MLALKRGDVVYVIPIAVSGSIFSGRATVLEDSDESRIFVKLSYDNIPNFKWATDKSRIIRKADYNPFLSRRYRMKLRR